MNMDGYVEAAGEPAGAGWCEAIVRPRDAPPRHCLTHASRECDGRHICGLHRWGRIEFGRAVPFGEEERAQ